jgi:MFS family permease
MAKGLKLIENRYSIIVLIFFIPYVLFQPPATVVMRKVGPRMFLTAITVLWGCCIIVSCLPVIRLFLLSDIGIRICQKMGPDGRSPSPSWYSRSWILSRLCIPLVMLVSSLRSPKKKCSLLPYWQYGHRAIWYPCVWYHANGRTCKPIRMAMDFHC